MARPGGSRLLSRMALQSSVQDCRRRLGGFSCRCLLWQAVKSTCSQLGFSSAPVKQGERSAHPNPPLQGAELDLAHKCGHNPPIRASSARQGPAPITPDATCPLGP